LCISLIFAADAFFLVISGTGIVKANWNHHIILGERFVGIRKTRGKTHPRVACACAGKPAV
jgi:hypothetical protein